MVSDRAVSVFMRSAMIAALLSSPLWSRDVDVKKDHATIVISNGHLTRVISFGDGNAGGIYSDVIVAGKSGRTFRGNRAGDPWFSFRVNNTGLTNLDACWVYDSYTTRPLPQGGAETTVHFTAALPAVRRLGLDLVMQMYPGSAVCREKIRLSAPERDTVRLSMKEGRIDFVYPVYAFHTGQKQPRELHTLQLAVWADELIGTDNTSSFIDRSLEEGRRVGRNLTQNYMYHPRRERVRLSRNRIDTLKGPIVIIPSVAGDLGVVYAYEHGAPDNDPLQRYMTVRTALTADALRLQTVYEKGLYVEGQPLTSASVFDTPWSLLGFFLGSPEEGCALVWKYLYAHISESVQSRQPEFYYNTWGMQRDEEKRGNDVRKVLTKERIVQEADRAALLSVDLFVLDDGWQDAFGDWNPDTVLYPHGLKWLADSLSARSMKPGLWFAALATDPAARITAAYPEWLIRDAQGRPIVGQWEKNFFCFDSEYREYFIRKCKERIDEGFRFFKWDGINSLACSSPFHHHGTEQNTPQERSAKQGFDLPLLVADAIRQLREYRPDVTVEIDITEPNRNVGLAMLSEGKYFWMNNGASTYGDYTGFRSMSTRFIPGLFASVIPPSLQTYANYPHNVAPYSAWRSNTNSSLIGGKGFWGNLAIVDTKDLERSGAMVRKAKRVMHQIAGIPLTVTGTVGASPEIYEAVDRAQGAGQVIGFSGAAMKYDHIITSIGTKRVLGVLNNAYRIRGDSLVIGFEFSAPDASREAFIIPGGNGVCLSSSTSWIDDIRLDAADGCVFVNGAPGTHTIEWDARKGRPAISADRPIASSVAERKEQGLYLVTITTGHPLTTIHLSTMR